MTIELIKEKWTEEDGKQFQAYLEGFSRSDKREWTKRIVNTKMSVLAVMAPDIKKIASTIAKGDYMSFLALDLCQYYENTLINGYLISQIEDFEVYKKWLLSYADKADNWATCDTLRFPVKERNKEDFFALAEELRRSAKPFVRRIGVSILFPFIVCDEYHKRLFAYLNSFEEEKEYYVNMILAWLICECFIKRRNEALEFLQHATLNAFVINKAVQKCRDSYRVTQEDKEMLLSFKRK